MKNISLCLCFLSVFVLGPKCSINAMQRKELFHQYLAPLQTPTQSNNTPAGILKISETIEHLVTKKEYNTASELCKKSNINFLPFLCKQLADLTFSLEHFYGDFFICTRLKGAYAQAIFIVNDIAGKRFVTAQGGKPCIWDISKKKEILSLSTTNYCCLIENQEEVMQLIDLIKEYWPYNKFELWLQEYHSIDQGYIPALFYGNFFSYLKYNGYIK